MTTPPPDPVQQRDARYAAEAESFAAANPALRDLVLDSRVTVRRGGRPAPDGKCIAYWMQRAQRGRDNHALDLAVDIGNLLGLPVVTFFAAISNFPHANLRHYAFLNQGLPAIEEDLAERHIGFVLRRDPHSDPLQFFADVRASLVVSDENPLRAPEQWRQKLARQLSVPFLTVDADVIVPSKLLEKAQYSAGVARPRLFRLLPHSLHAFENPRPAKRWRMPRTLHRDDPHKDITRGWRDFDRSVAPVNAWHGGARAANKRLRHFCSKLLENYDRDRNHPERDGTSALSPYLHFGHIGPLTIALAVRDAVRRHPHLASAQDSFFNELIVWRELSINFVRYQPGYDSTACADAWARTTIAEHDRDHREVLYPLAKLEHAQTHDELWNAAQTQMLRSGWMHNYMRMYWAKKILEWTPNAATAMKYAVHLNDKYFLDGRDPNGYAGIAWAILGKFDRAWGSRPVFGKRRFMSASSTQKKAQGPLYIAKIRQL